ncbi:MAG: hypothetical protein IJT95_00805, partial [Abditibacteriota bacterium]|nr:hypothetical protein [Abditibacteriota bacterium]
PGCPAVVCVCHMTLQGTNCQDEHMKLIKYYDLPAVSIKNAVWNNCVEGTRNVKDIIADSVHPTDLGHSMLAELVNRDIFDRAKRSKPARTPAPAHKTLPKPYISDELQFPRYYYPALTKAKTAGWKLNTQKTEIVNARDVYGSWWTADAPGKTLETEVEGTCISVCYQRFTHGGGSIICYVDGRETATLDCDFTGGWGDYWATRFLARDLENKTHTLTFVSAPNSHEGPDNKVVLTAIMTGGNKQ